MSHGLKMYKADEEFGNGLVYSILEVEEVLAMQDKELDRLRMETHKERNEYINMVYLQKKEIERLESAVAALKGELYELRYK